MALLPLLAGLIACLAASVAAQAAGEAMPPTRTSEATMRQPGRAEHARLALEVIRQVKPHWKAPAGAGAEQMQTTVELTLSPTGEITNVEPIGTTGATTATAALVKRHQDNAVRAIRRAAPFRLPPQSYDAWKVIRLTFDRRLSK
ncbi:hypothetical protein E2493_01650 [Sphingomonas parva]|uniref:Energy transducer TonB n=1 Tax=Sphingomonas parva TaxID=2555898 RepID=A0A4Y8ZVB4_9SPHN|nr:TonB C-terminal domain-containing protein [Sphingomonas parva]TFI59983.1 hypothetical protein E2493_01650 [Sphingomonas parva]